MLPARGPGNAGFEDEEWPSGVVRRGRPPSNYPRELARWFGEPAAPALKAVGTDDVASARIPFLIF
jgi:hypothetical protein